MKMTEDAVRECIRQNVYDPELGLNVVDLGLLYDIQIRGDKEVYIEMTLTTPACPLYNMIASGVQSAIKARFGEDVKAEVNLVFDPPWTPDRMSEEARARLGFL